MRCVLAFALAAGILGSTAGLVAAAPPAEPKPQRATTAANPISAATSPAEAAAVTSPATARTAVEPTPQGADPEANVKQAAVTSASTEKPRLPRPAAPTLHATIDLTSQTMTVKAHGRPLHTWKISSGREGYHTPTGTFKPTWTSEMWFSTQYDDAPMPFSVFFNGGIATHGTNATGRLGRPASHGCVRLTNANAEAFYRLVHRHGLKRTRIVVTGATPSTPAAVARRRPARTYDDAPRRNARRAYENPYAGGYGYSYGERRRRAYRDDGYYEPRRRIYREPRYVAPSNRMVFPGDRVGRRGGYGSTW